jgi:hypothetical protein
LKLVMWGDAARRQSSGSKVICGVPGLCSDAYTKMQTFAYL